MIIVRVEFVVVLGMELGLLSWPLSGHHRNDALDSGHESLPEEGSHFMLVEQSVHLADETSQICFTGCQVTLQFLIFI